MWGLFLLYRGEDPYEYRALPEAKVVAGMGPFEHCLNVYADV
jgi:hypothetical protein